MQLIDILHRVPLFSELDDRELACLERLVKTRQVDKKNIIVQEDDPGDSLFIVLEGMVKISSYTADGKEVVLALLGKGAFFGEMSLLDRQPRSATVTTMEPTRLAQISRRDLDPLLLEQPQITLKLLTEVVSRLRKTSRVLERISSMDVPHRLYAYLIDFCQRFGQLLEDGKYDVVLPTHQLMADQLSTSRETVSRAISMLKKEGILVPGKRRGKMQIDVDTLNAMLDSF